MSLRNWLQQRSASPEPDVLMAPGPVWTPRVPTPTTDYGTTYRGWHLWADQHGWHAFGELAGIEIMATGHLRYGDVEGHKRAALEAVDRLQAAGANGRAA